MISNSEPFHLSQGGYSEFSSDRDDQRIFLGGTIWQVFLGYSKQSRFVVVPAHIPANKVQPNLFCSLEIFKFWKFGMGFIGGLILGPGIFFLVLIFAPIRSSLSLEIWSIPLVFQNSSKWLNKETEIKIDCSRTKIFLRYL